MWYGLRMSPEAGPDIARTASDLLQSTSRSLILTTGGVYLVWHFVAIVIWPESWNPWLIMPIVALTCVLAYGLLPKQLLVAQLIWQMGLMGVITLAIYLYRQPEIAFFYTLLPLVAVVTLGWPAGLLAEGLVIAVMWWISRSPIMPFLPTSYGLGVATAGALAGFLGWASTRPLLTVLGWYVFSFAQARENMESARQHRAQLACALKDLDRAYYRLHRANTALVAAQKAAEEAERFKAEFATNVSHELRTPLNLIVGFSEMMLTSPESYGDVQIPGPYRSDLNAIYHSAQHLLALVDDVLDLARLEVGKIPLAREEVNLALLMAETVDIVHDYVAAKGLELRVGVPEDIPPLWVDRLRVRQVLLNLLVNAARYTERGWICVDISRQGGEVVVRVTDTGQGITKQDLPMIFQEFHATDEPLSGWHTGTGLGLPISKKFIELHGGRMGVESTYLQGTTIWFTLPCAPAPVPEQSLSPMDRPHPVVRLGASERIVVLVHDDPQVVSLLQRYLDGYRVVGAADIREGVALTEEIKAIALVTDQRQETPPTLGSTLVVSLPLPDRCQAAEALRANDLLTKPVSRQELLASVKRMGQSVQRVLIADDDPDMVRLFRRMLRTLTPVPDFLEAYTGEEAWRLIQEEEPDLVLLDLGMPELDGRRVLEKMAADPGLASIPTIIASGRIQDYVRMQLSGSVQIARLEGFQLGEIVRVLEAVFNALAPGWHSPESKEPMPRGALAGSPALVDRPLPLTPGPVEAH